MKKLTPEEKFFYQHAGFSYDPKKETRAQGKRRCAVALAEAEAFARRKVSLGEWRYEWESDWSVGSHVKEYDTYAQEPGTCECVILQGKCGECGQWKTLASLGCIDDADDNYHRVIEAELALEASRV